MLVAFTATRDIAKGEELTVLQWEDNGIDINDGGKTNDGVHTRDGGKTRDGVITTSDGGMEVEGGGRFPTGMTENRVVHRPLLVDKKRRYLPTAMSQYCLT